MILFNKAIKADNYSKERKILKDLIKMRRNQFCINSEKIDISFKLESKSQWFEDKGMSYIEWQVVTVWFCEVGLWKKEDQDESFINWFYK